MTKRCQVTFETVGKTLHAKVGASLMEVAVEGHIDVRSDCGGGGICGKCLVNVAPQANLTLLTSSEKAHLTKAQIDSGYRLACQARVNSGPVAVSVPDMPANGDDTNGKVDIGDQYTTDPLISRIIFSKPIEFDLHDKDDSALLLWLQNRLKMLSGRLYRIDHIETLRRLCRSTAEERITAVCHEQKGLTAVVDGEKAASLGIAFDVGTTTVAAYLCDLQHGRRLTGIASMNPQRRYGEDVISRIAFAGKKDGNLKRLQTIIVQTMNDLIRQGVGQSDKRIADVDEITIAGNTAMQQIVAGIDLRELGVSPYRPAVREYPDVKAASLGLNLNPGTNVHFMPVVSGFVGGDAVSAFLAGNVHPVKESCLIIDIGTNGELILSDRENVWATSCATGPALEGATITCGMRASSGAIYQVEKQEKDILYRVMGGDHIRPSGICGSGIIDAVAVFLEAGILLPHGRFDESARGVVCDSKGIGRRFFLVPKEKSASGEAIFVTLEDIRQIQLAKAALRLGIEYLLQKAGLEKVDRLVLTGAFGARFNWHNAVAIGMLPEKNVFDEIEIRDNLAGEGAVMALVNRRFREKAIRIGRKIQFIELAKEPDFTNRFVHTLNFPQPPG